MAGRSAIAEATALMRAAALAALPLLLAPSHAARRQQLHVGRPGTSACPSAVRSGASSVCRDDKPTPPGVECKRCCAGCETVHVFEPDEPSGVAVLFLHGYSMRGTTSAWLNGLISAADANKSALASESSYIQKPGDPDPVDLHRLLLLVAQAPVFPGQSSHVHAANPFNEPQLRNDSTPPPMWCGCQCSREASCRRRRRPRCRHPYPG